MYIDTTALPEDFNASEYITRWNQLSSQGLLIKDPMTVSNTNDGLWSQINKTIPYDSPWTDPTVNRIVELELKNRLLELRLFVLEGVFTQEESNNIKSMLTSNDEASITLANTIIENVGL
jgi:hypothetical protein